MTPTARFLDLLRRSGFTVATVERWIPKIGKRRDCFGWADLLACNPVRRQVALVQTTTKSNLSARIAKAKRRPALLTWLRAGGAAWFHGRHQRGGRWHCHMVELQVDGLADVILTPSRRRGRTPYQGGLFDENAH